MATQLILTNWKSSGLPFGVQRNRVTRWRSWLISVGGFTNTISTVLSGEIWAAKIMGSDLGPFTKIGDGTNLTARGALWLRNDVLHYKASGLTGWSAKLSDYVVGGNNAGTNITDGWMATIEETR
jgi:hypothetical protein